MKHPLLSALVIVHNEEKNLADCLETLRFAEELIVVLDKCTDRSKEIAQKFGARLLEGSWDIEGERRNAGLALCKGDWVLEIDADERVPEALRTEILETCKTSSFSWHELPIDNYVGSRLVRYGWGASFGTTSAPRLSQKGVKEWGLQRIHPSLVLKGEKGPRLKNPFIHYVDENISDMLHRFDRYTTARAQDLLAQGRIGSFPSNLRRLFSRFYKCYVRRKGYREGGYGFLIALLAGLYPLVSYLKAKLEPDLYKRPS